MKAIFKPFILLILAIGVVACEESDSSSTLSTVAKITAFAFQSNDTFPGLGEAVFVIDQLADTGRIRMRENDSVRYQTPVNRIVPKITYYTTPSSVTFYLGDSAVALTGYDTLDLSIKPIKIHVVAQNTDYDKWYTLNFDVHTMDGDYFHWDTLQTAISNQTNGTQKALLFNKQIYYYQSNGSTIRVFISDDMANTWKEENVKGLPTSCKIRQIVEGDSMLFYGEGKKIYYSSNGYEWKNTDAESEIIALYMCMHTNENRIWLAAYDTTHCPRFYSIGRDLKLRLQTRIGLRGDSLPIDFPIEEYATIPFQSSSLHQHAIIAGGYDREGKMTNARWNLEYNQANNSYAFTNMAEDGQNLPPFIGSSISYYGTKNNKFLYLLGGMLGQRNYLNNVYVSLDEGLHWTESTDSATHKKPESISGRFHTNTFVDDKGNIYIIGGEDNSTTYSDVYRGRMNSITWPEIGN